MVKIPGNRVTFYPNEKYLEGISVAKGMSVILWPKVEVSEPMNGFSLS